MEKPYREAGGPTEGMVNMVNMEANRGANPRGLRAVSSVFILETAKSALWRGYYLNSMSYHITEWRLSPLGYGGCKI